MDVIDILLYKTWLFEILHRALEMSKLKLTEQKSWHKNTKKKYENMNHMLSGKHVTSKQRCCWCCKNV